MKQELNSRHDWNVFEAFNYIDATNDGFVNHRNIQIFLKNQGYFVPDEQLIAIVRRMDSDADQKVVFNEFQEAFGLPGATGNYTPVPKRSVSPMREYMSSLSRDRSSPLRETIRNTSLKKSVKFDEYSNHQPETRIINSISRKEMASPLRRNATPTRSPINNRDAFLSPERSNFSRTKEYSQNRISLQKSQERSYQNMVKNAVTRRLI